MVQDSFGKTIATLRKEKNMTQAELAERLYVSDKTVSKWETGKGYPDISLLEPIAKAFGVTSLYFKVIFGVAFSSSRSTSNIICPAFVAYGPILA